jgi:hypothetical protein
MKRIVAFCLCLCLAAGLVGCDLWLNGDYSKVVPHVLPDEAPKTDKVEVSTYDGLRDAILGAVSSGMQEAVIYYPKEDPRTVSSYMDVAVRYITQEHPVGAYAVSQIKHEIGTSSGVQAVALQITYSRSIAQIQKLQSVSGLVEAKDMIASALEKCEASVVFYMDSYDGTDFVQFVSDYVDDNPDKCMELPQISAMSYPETGTSRVIELVFSYQTSRDTLRSMQQNVADVFESAELYVSGDGDKWEKYAQLYSFLMERHDYTLQTSITPSYSLLRHGVGDSKAFALVYAAMCRRAGLDCETVAGTKDGEVYTWNVIADGDVYYYVDLIRCSQNGRFYPARQWEMGGYVWDYSVYR